MAVRFILSVVLASILTLALEQTASAQVKLVKPEFAQGKTLDERLRVDFQNDMDVKTVTLDHADVYDDGTVKLFGTLDANVPNQKAKLADIAKKSILQHSRLGLVWKWGDPKIDVTGMTEKQSAVVNPPPSVPLTPPVAPPVTPPVTTPIVDQQPKGPLAPEDIGKSLTQQLGQQVFTERKIRVSLDRVTVDANGKVSLVGTATSPEEKETARQASQKAIDGWIKERLLAWPWPAPQVNADGLVVAPASIAQNLQATVNQSEQVQVSLLPNGADPNMTVQIVAPPVSGALDPPNGAAMVRYTHNGGDQSTSDSFTYRLHDPRGSDSNIGTVTISIVLSQTSGTGSAAKVPWAAGDCGDCGYSFCGWRPNCSCAWNGGRCGWSSHHRWGGLLSRIFSRHCWASSCDTCCWGWSSDGCGCSSSPLAIDPVPTALIASRRWNESLHAMDPIKIAAIATGLDQGTVGGNSALCTVAYHPAETEANAFNPQLANHLYGLAYTEYWRGSYDEALKGFARATELNRNDPKIWYYKAFAEIALQKEDDAMASLSRAVLLEAQSANPAVKSEISHALERVQGNLRQRIEEAKLQTSQELKRRACPVANPSRVAAAEQTP